MYVLDKYMKLRMLPMYADQWVCPCILTSKSLINCLGRYGGIKTVYKTFYNELSGIRSVVQVGWSLMPCNATGSPANV